MKHIGTVQAPVTDREPTAAELDAIEHEMPVIEAEVELLDAYIVTLYRPASELDTRRLLRTRRKMLAARRALEERRRTGWPEAA
ncbi:DUF6284 family protein [Streptomyces violens]|uniref:DUF6284 family protein n=1 Tax=Streptomyces violens TaxID=66377 RepID=UPI0004BF227A|nr:DUF6284 family protein [Streptomyces violens]